MIVDNFDILKKWMTFDDYDFYFVQIIQRKKDGNPELMPCNNNYRKVRSFQIYSPEDFEKRRPSIVRLCQDNNARAYIYINPRNFESLSLDMAIEALTNLKRGTPEGNKDLVDSCASKYCKFHCKKKWIIDIDTQDQTVLSDIIDITNSCRNDENPNGEPNGAHNVLEVIPTVNGYHLLTRSFDSGMFVERVKEYNRIEHNGELMDEKEVKNMVKKDCQTVLYFEKTT